MTRTKDIPESGTVLNVDDEKIQDKPIEISYTQAKRLIKKPMSDKQKANVQKLVEMNRIKWEAAKKAKEEQERERIAKENELKTQVVVKPKRVYKERVKKLIEPIDEESEDEPEPVKPKSKNSSLSLHPGHSAERVHKKPVMESSSESEEEYQLKKVEKKVQKKSDLIRKIDNVIKEVRRPSYLDKLNDMWV